MFRLAYYGGGSTSHHTESQPRHYTPPHHSAPKPVSHPVRRAPAPVSRPVVHKPAPAPKVDHVQISAAARHLAAVMKQYDQRTQIVHTQAPAKPAPSNPKPSGGGFWSSIGHAVSSAANHVETAAKDVTHTVEHAATEVASTVHHVAQTVEHAAVHTEQAAVMDVRQVRQTVSQDAQKVEHAVTKEAGKVAQDVRQTVTHVKQGIQNVGHDVAQGARNMADHPLATVEAAGELVGGAAETVGGIAFGTATIETGVGGVLGGAVAVDGASNTVAGAEDLASIFNGNMNAVGTHNTLANAAKQYAGTTGEQVYNLASMGLGLFGGDVGTVSRLMDGASQGIGVARQFMRDGMDGLQNFTLYRPQLSIVGAGAEGGSLSGLNQVDKAAQSDTMMFAQGVDKGTDEVATKATLQGIDATDVTTKPSETVNEWWQTSKGYDNPPYKPGTTVTQFTVQEDTSFVRVYDGINSRQQGGWLMRPEDIKGLTPEQIRDKYTLPQVPTQITDVIISKGSTLEGGISNGIPAWGTGGGIQYDTMGKFIGEFVNPRPLK